jgi:hypothetical protein
MKVTSQLIKNEKTLEAPLCSFAKNAGKIR